MDERGPNFFFFVLAALFEVALVNFEDVAASGELHNDA
jgi:hypothetical protein